MDPALEAEGWTQLFCSLYPRQQWKDTGVYVPTQQRKSLETQRNAHLPPYQYIKINPTFWLIYSVFSPDLALAWSLAGNECHGGLHWEIPGLHVFDWEHSLQSLPPLTQKRLFLSIPRALALETLRFFSQTSVLFMRTHHTASPVPAPSAAVHTSSWAPSLPPPSFHLGICKMGGKNIFCDLTLHHVFKANSLGFQDTFPQGTKGISAARGLQILFYLHIHSPWRPGTAAVLHHAMLIPPDNTSLTGSAEDLTKPLCQSTIALMGNWAGIRR